MSSLRISAVTVLCLLAVRTSALQLSMVASRAPSLWRPSTLGIPAPPATTGGVTGSLVSQLAEVALKHRLADQQGVNCDVKADSGDLLLRGQVGPVTVSGRGWQSQLGLTVRAIEARVETCTLDVGRILTERKLTLTKPSKGTAMVALNAADFGNFITHPLMKPPGIASGASERIQFLKDGVQISAKEGSIVFYATFLEQTWKCTLQRNGASEQRAKITVEPTEGDDEEGMSVALTRVVSDFFNDMVFELDGVSLSFRDMMVTSKGDAPSVMLSLSMLVRKFPSRRLQF